MITPEVGKHPTQDVQVEMVRVRTDRDLIELRKSDWHEGALRILSFPSRVIGYLGYEPPLVFSGLRVTAPALIVKGAAGDFEVFPEGGVIDG